MGSDRARVSYDPSRHWRGVINQQGRVTLEADWNEAGAIAAEEDRAQLVDVIGASGTPDDGYRVLPVKNADGNATGDLTIQKGTLYVGGERMVLDADLDYADQPDWVDRAGDPLWVEPAAVLQQNENEAVYLLLREQEVGAVEDPALLDIALGGPDTSERLRIVQRVVRGSTDANNCAGALADLEKEWAELGLQFDPATMRLDSASSLQVSFEQAPSAATPCEPVAQGGYLGAENQLIRVQVASVDEKGVPTLVWGFDNAYFLYRISHFAADVAGGTTTITLASAPVDSFHQPAKSQAVEVLEAAAELTSSDFIAATTGIVTTVDTAYQPDTQELVISTALSTPTTDSPLLFLRVWEDTIVYTGGPVALGDTGLQVTLASSTGVYHAGDYWTFAARPGTPTMVSPVYPERILDAPQPPDGPRLWACQLAVVAWSDGSPAVSDCRAHFDNLVELTARGSGGCCTIDVSPADVDGGAKLQALIDTYAGHGPTTICLQPGTYKLPAPLVIRANHVGLTIQGCEAGVVLEATAGPPASFLLGLILLERPRNFTLRGVQLVVPFVRFSFGRTAVAGIPEERQALLAAYGRGLALSIGVYALGGAGLSFENCTFAFSEGGSENVFGAGVFGTRAVRGLEIVDCNFVGREGVAVPFSELARSAQASPPYQVRFGYLQIPTRAQEASFQRIGVAANQETLVLDQPLAKEKTTKQAAAAARKRAAAEKAAAAAAATQIGVPTLGDAVIERNLFDGLTVPVLVMGRVGKVRIEDNTVRSCYGGFWLVTLGTTTGLSMLDRVSAGGSELYSSYLVPGRLTALADPVLQFASVLGRILPITPPSDEPTSVLGSIPLASKAGLAEAEGLFTQLYSLQVAHTAKAAAPPEAAPAAPAAPPQSAPPTGAAAPAAEGAPVLIETAPKEVFELPPKLSAIFVAPRTAAASDVVPEADPGTALVPRLDVNGNEVDAVLANADSGPGLLVLALDQTGVSSLVCTGNRIRSRVVDGATVSLWALVECTVTGNIVSNEIEDGKNDRSIVLLPQVVGKVPAVAVTGNVLIGPVALPARPLAAPLNHWNPLNTVMDYISP